MFDYAQSQLLGRAAADAEISTDEDGRVFKAVFVLACNIPFRRGGQTETRTVFRRVMALGSFAHYVSKCQNEDGLSGRLINVIGTMDDERHGDIDREITRVAPGAGSIKIMDRRQSNG